MTLLLWIYRNWMPREGWVPFGLTLSAILILGWAVTEADWVPEVSIVWYSILILFCLSYLLFRKGKGSRLSWVALLLYWIAIPFYYFVPIRPLGILFDGVERSRTDLSQDWLQFSTRLTVWLQTAINGGSSQDTIAFAIFLALIAGLITIFFVWSIYQWGQPYLGVGVLLFGLGFNTYYGNQPLGFLMTAILCGTVTIALWQIKRREIGWSIEGTDYSEEIPINNRLIAALIGITILVIAAGLPAIPYSEIARAFRSSAPIVALDNQLSRLFGGVAATEPSASGSGNGDESREAGVGRDPGIFPRAYLLGSPPELAETPLFAAELSGMTSNSSATHWRATTYDDYTGQGWRQSRGDSERLGADVELPLPILNETPLTIRQEIRWIDRSAASLYITIGQPQRIDRPVELRRQPNNGELISIQPPELEESGGYQALSIAFPIDPQALNQVDMTAISDEELIERYTALPTDITPRTRELARQIVADIEGPYAQARALEAYLRQYRYNLDVEPPPPGREPVDYFLFELEEGYCDYFATSMVVLARSLGMPARLGVGYIVPELTPEGEMIVRQDHGHSWAEIYFPEHGWVEFEPTAGFEIVVPEAEMGDIAVNENESPDLTAAAPPLNENEPDWSRGQLLSASLAILALILSVVTALQLRRHPFFRRSRGLTADYEAIIELAGIVGYQHRETNTPSEFLKEFSIFILGLEMGEEVNRNLPAQLTSFIREYESRRYGSGNEAGPFSYASEPNLRRWRMIQQSALSIWLSRKRRQLGSVSDSIRFRKPIP